MTKTIKISSLSELEKHSTMLSGKMYQDKVGADGALEAIVSQKCMSKLDIMVGDIIELNRFMDAKGNAIRVKIVGVFTNKEADDTSVRLLYGFVYFTKSI